MIYIKEKVCIDIQRILSKNGFFECGGILGRNENCVKAFKFDNVGSRTHKNMYFPDTVSLNLTLKEWQTKGITFCGFVHSHPNCSPELSNADINFARKTIDNFDSMDSLLMGIYLVSTEKMSDMIVWYDVSADRVERVYPVFLN